MGFILNTSDDEFGLEARRESFYLYSSEQRERVEEDGRWKDGPPTRAIFTYESEERGRATVEFEYEDIPALRRALDRIEEHAAEFRGRNRDSGRHDG